MHLGGEEGVALIKSGIVFLDIPAGRGRSHLLGRLKDELGGMSAHTFYYSPETGVGQLFHDLLNLAGPGFLVDRPEAGPVIRRYLHHRYCSMVNGFKPYRPLTVGQEQELVLNTLVSLVRFLKLEYWFIDDWLQEDYNDLMSAVLPRLVDITDLTVIVTGDAFPRNVANQVLTLDDLNVPQGDALVDLWAQLFHLDHESAMQIAVQSDGNWHEVAFMAFNGATNLADAVWKAYGCISDDAKSVARSAAVMASRVSEFLMDIFTDGHSDKVVEELGRCRLLFKEGPLYRFPSSRVRELILQSIPLDERNRILEDVTDGMASRRYEDYWERIAHRYQQLGKTKKETYALLMGLRHEKGTPKAKSIIDRLDHIGVVSPGYKRLKTFCLYLNNDMEDAARTLESLNRQTLVDKANLVRIYAYAGNLDKAVHLVEELRSHTSTVRRSAFLPKVAAELPVVDVLKGDITSALDEMLGVLPAVAEDAYMREHVAAYYNSLAVLLQMSGETREGYNYFLRALDAAQPLESSEVYLKVLVNLADSALELEGPLDSFRYVSRAIRSTAPCSLQLRVIALVNYIMAHLQYNGFPKTAAKELLALVHAADPKTKFDGLESLATALWLSGQISEATNLINSMVAPGRSEQQRLLALRGFLDDTDSLSRVEFIDSTLSAVPLLWGYRRTPEKCGQIKLLASDRPLLRFLKSYPAGRLDLLISIATEAEQKWYLADAMFMYELMSDCLLAGSKLPLLEEAYRLALALGFESKTEQLAIRLREESASGYGADLERVRMLEKNLLSVSVEHMELQEFLSYLESLLGYNYAEFSFDFGVGGRSYELGWEGTKGQIIELYLPPFHGRLTLPRTWVADAMVLRAVLMSAARRWKLRYGTLDALTGLYNRMYGDDALAQAWGDWERNGRTFVVAYLDVNDFKRINDTYGHDVGDEVLRSVARVLRDNVRSNDTVIRWGGDEFLLILRDTDKHGAKRVLERVQKTLKQLDRPVQVSYGIVEPVEVRSLAELVSKADQLMYSHKRQSYRRRQRSV